jgi:hypothetical protein
MPPAHPSPDPPPARPLFIEARDAASDAEAGIAFDAGLGGAGVDGDSGGGSDAGALLDGAGRNGSAAASIAGADRVVAGLRPRFRNCYKLGVATDPKMHGRANLSTSVSAKGDVVSVTVTQVDSMNPRVVSCIVGVMQKAKFTAPGGAGASLQVPVTFRP